MAKDKPPQRQPRKSGKNSDDKTADGAAIWQKLTAQTRPLSAAQRDKGRDKGRDKSQAMKPVKKTSAKPIVSAKKLGNAAALAASDRPAPLSSQGGPATAARDKPPPRAEIEQKQRRRLSRGRTELDGTLDLHGMTLVEAEAALKNFIAYHRAQGHRWVLVITGKGVRGEGRLRKALPEWLSAPAQSQAIAEFDQAAIAHGGGGAFYLRLRRAGVNKASPKTS